MSRKFKSANYEETLNQTIRLAEALPPEHLARFVVDILAQLDLSPIYEQYAPSAGKPLRRKSCWVVVLWVCNWAVQFAQD